MVSVPVKLKKANAPTYVEYFNTLPTWEGLTSRIAERFTVPKQDTAIGYLNSTGDTVTLIHEQGLQEYYKSLHQSSEIKFVVLDRQTPDSELLSVVLHLHPDSFMQLEPQSLPLGLLIPVCMGYPTPVCIY
jgi:hypothetical protein